jgi:hypothetical protein
MGGNKGGKRKKKKSEKKNVVFGCSVFERREKERDY